MEPFYRRCCCIDVQSIDSDQRRDVSDVPARPDPAAEMAAELSGERDRDGVHWPVLAAGMKHSRKSFPGYHPGESAVREGIGWT